MLCRWWYRRMVLKHHQIGKRHWKPLYRIIWKSWTRGGHSENEKSCNFHRKDGLKGQVMCVWRILRPIETLAEKRNRSLVYITNDICIDLCFRRDPWREAYLFFGLKGLIYHSVFHPETWFKQKNSQTSNLFHNLFWNSYKMLENEI